MCLLSTSVKQADRVALRVMKLREAQVIKSFDLYWLGHFDSRLGQAFDLGIKVRDVHGHGRAAAFLSIIKNLEQDVIREFPFMAGWHRLTVPTATDHLRPPVGLSGEIGRVDTEEDVIEFHDSMAPPFVRWKR